MSEKRHCPIHSLIGKAERVLIIAAPDKYLDELSQVAKSHQLSTNAQTTPKELFEFILIFLRNKSDLGEYAAAAVSVLTEQGNLWFGYPSLQSSYSSDITVTEGWEVLNDAGWESMSDLSLDSTWNVKNFAQQTLHGH